MAKRILIYTNHFYPEQFKINEVVDWLSKEDFHIRVITCIPNYPLGKFFKGYGIKSIRDDFYQNNVVVNRLPLIPRGNGNYIIRFFNYLSYFVSTFFFTIYLLIFIKKYDKILVHHTSPILIAIHPIFYGFFYKVEKYLWDLDIWPDTLSALGVIKSKKILKLIETLVTYIYGFYDKILISSKGFKEIIRNRFKGEIIYFPNWAESTIEKNIQNPKIMTNVPSNEFIIMYTGNIGYAQNFELLAQTIKYLKSKKIHWVFIGDGSFKKKFIKTLKSFDVYDKCRFINQVNVSEIPSYVYNSDALLLSLKANELFSRTVPAKLQSYMALGKLIIASISGEGADLIRKSNSGIVETNSNYIELANSINKIIRLDNSKIKSIGNKGRQFYEKNFHSELRKNQILSLFK